MSDEETLFWETLATIKDFQISTYEDKRFVRTSNGYCPICAVARKLLPDCPFIEKENALTAGELIGLSRKFINGVMDAADDYAEEMRDYKTFIKMRKKLIEVIGLEESV